MKPKTLIAASCAACLLVLLTPGLISQDGPTPEEAAQRQALDESMLRAQPGPEHWLLARLAGDWRVDTTFHGTGADEPPTVEGQAEGRLVAGERFLLLELRIGSEPWTSERVTLFGFDRRVSAYTAVLADSHGTHYVEASGSYRQDEDRIVLDGEDTDPQLGTTAHFRFVLQLEESGFRHDVYLLRPDGEELLLMESRFRPRE